MLLVALPRRGVVTTPGRVTYHDNAKDESEL
jgi:hypothetical protein